MQALDFEIETKPGRSRVPSNLAVALAQTAWTTSACKALLALDDLEITFWPSCSDFKAAALDQAEMHEQVRVLSGVMKP